LRQRSGGPARILALGALLLFAVVVGPRAASAQDEFLLNDDRIDRNQWAPRAALGANGTILVVWMDGRNGAASSIDYDIYLMSLHDPLGLGSSLNRRVNDGIAGSVQGFPDIAASPAGTYLCVWEDSRSGNRDIFATALDSVGTPITPSFRVNDDAGSADQLLPRAVTMGASAYMVVWGDGREGQGEIYASYRTSNGAPLGGNRRVSVDPVTGGSYQGEPAAAVGPSGRKLVVWLDGREGGGAAGGAIDVYGQWLDAAGDPIGGNFKINGTTGGKCASPTVAGDPALGYVVAWIDRRDAPGDAGDVYAQRFGPTGVGIGGNVRVNDDPTGREQREVHATAGSGGAAAVVWEDYRGNLGIDANVECSIVPYDGGAPGSNFRVNTDPGGRQGTPSAIWDGRDAYLGLWEDGRHGSPDIYAISYFSDGARRGSDTQMNDDAAPFDQRRPRLGHGPGRYVATWTDRRSQSGDLYAQWITAAGAREGVNHLLWKDDFIDRPVASASAVSRSGRALVAAQIARFSDAGDIRGFLYTAGGVSPSSSFWIGDVLPSAQSSPTAAALDSEFAVVWIDGRDGAPRLYGQRLDQDGARMGVNHPVLDIEPAEPVHALDLAADPMGGYWLAYVEGGGADQRLWALHLDPALAPTGPPVAVAPGIPGSRDAPSVGVSDAGRAEVVWLGLGEEGYGHVFHASVGSGVSALAAADVEAEPGRPAAAPTIAVFGTSAVVAWGERGPLGDWSIWLQRFQDGAAAAPPARVDQDLSSADQFDPCTGLDGSGHALIIWSDLRSLSSGSDILGRAFQLAPTAADDPPPTPEPDPPPPAPAPRATRIGPARPNPFSSATAAPVEVAATAPHTLARVWNARGERVATLVDGVPPAARFTLRWDGTDDRGRPVASGVYWITVESGGERRATRVVHLR
jgi:hypothetical protein